MDKLNKIFINYTYIATKEIIDILGAISLPIKNVAEPEQRGFVLVFPVEAKKHDPKPEN